MKFKLSRYIIPSVISMILVGAYTNIDGFFIGNAVGDPGLAAINIAWPIVALITAAGTGLGVGASVIINGLRGEGRMEAAERVKKSALLLLGVTGVLLSALTLATYRPLLILMGAADETLKYAEDYSCVVSAGALFQVLGSGLVVLLRNDEKAGRAMAYTVVGLVIHVLLDVLLVELGALGGVAIATVISQLAVAAFCLMSMKFDWKQKGKGELSRWREILKASLAPVGVNFVPSLVLFFTNMAALSSGGTAAVSAYAVMSYAVYTYDYVFQGVCDGVQPALSYYFGAQDERSARYAARCAAVILAVCAVLFALVTPALMAILPGLFDVSAEAASLIRSGLAIYAFSYLFKAAVKFECAYCYIAQRFSAANFLTYIDPLLLTPLSLLILPRLMGTDGLWWAMVVSQAVTALIGIALFRRRSPAA